MSERELKSRLYEQFARVGSALASPARLEILDVLAQGERSVDILAERASLSVANASRHLQVLRDAGLVEAERRGTWAYYRLVPDAIERLREVFSVPVLAPA